MRALIILVIGLVALGCEKANPPAADCVGAIDHMAALQRDVLKDVAADERPHFEERIAKMREAMLGACRETKWSAAMTTCMKNMKSLDDGGPCEKLETPEQKAFADKAIEATQKPTE